jgi:hypothetical protein
MPNFFQTRDGMERKPSTPIPLQLADGSPTEGVWAGSATEEKLGWWLAKPGNQIAQSEPVSAVASKADDNGEMIWGDAPNDARLIFVLEASPPGKNYRLAKLVTMKATPSQMVHFRHKRSALIGTLQPDGNIKRIPPLNPPQPPPPAQNELF